MNIGSKIVGAVALLGIVLLSPTLISIRLALPSQHLNKYEQAQNATVLIESAHGFGSGFVVQRGPRLFVWTAAHVVRECNLLKIRQVIRFEGHKVGESAFLATVIARDEKLDLALLYLDAPGNYFSPVRFSHTDVLPVGVELYHVGNFAGPRLDGSVSTGILSQIGISPGFDGWPWPVVDQMTTIIVPGSSGGPVFTGNGSVVGVAVGHVSPGVEFFVPLRAMILFTQQHNVRFALGANYCPSDGELYRLAGISKYIPPEPIVTLPLPELPKNDTVGKIKRK